MIRYERRHRDLFAIARVPVGTRDVELHVALGPWEGTDPDPGGLRGRPVVVVVDPDLVPLAVAGARRSGGLAIEPVAGEPGVGAGLLRSRAEANVVVTRDGGVLGTVRALGGRAIPALPSDDPAAIGALLAACPVEVDVPFPSLEPGRSRARAALLEAGGTTEHHLVEVDPRPAFDELGADASSASVAQLAAAAAGVLAGRVAAGARRWRSR